MFSLLSVIGVFNATYLLFKHSNSTTSCMAGASCNEVLSSVYASILGVPIAALGVSLYLVLLMLTLFHKKDGLNHVTYHRLTMVLLTPATAVGVVLSVVQFTQLNAFCPFCGLNSLILVILFILSFKAYKAGAPQSMSESTPRFFMSISQCLAIGAVAIIPVVASHSKPNHRGVTHHANPVIGLVAGKEVTLSDLKKSTFNARWLDLNRKLHQFQKQFLSQHALDIEAKKNNMDSDQYIRREVLSNINISESEIKAFYNEQKDGIPKDKTYDDVKPKIRKYLMHEKKKLAVNKHMKTLDERYDVTLLISSPDPVKIKRNPFKTHAIGDSSAPIHVIEFADLQCGHCKEAFVSFKKIIKQLGDNVYFEYRHFPLPFNRYSKSFAKASYCAGNEDKYYEFIELTFANQEKLGKVTPNDIAKELNLNANDFDACMSGAKAQRMLDADLKEGERLGIQSTPTFFINGQLMIGAPTMDDMAVFF